MLLALDDLGNLRACGACPAPEQDRFFDNPQNTRKMSRNSQGLWLRPSNKQCQPFELWNVSLCVTEGVHEASRRGSRAANLADSRDAVMQTQQSFAPARTADPVSPQENS